MPPPARAVFPVKIQLMTLGLRPVCSSSTLYMAPPPTRAALSLKRQFMIFGLLEEQPIPP